MNVVKVSEGIKSYINTLVDDLAVNDFLIGAVRPMIRMAIENNFYKVNNILKVLADKNGDIDFNKLVDETMTSMLNSKQATYPIGNQYQHLHTASLYYLEILAQHFCIQHSHRT